MPLKRADLSDTRRFEDGDDFLVLRTQLTAHERDMLADLQQNYRMDAGALAGDPDADRSIEMRSRVAATNRWLFGILGIEWSLDGEPTADAYDGLDEESGNWVNDCVAEVLAERRKRAEKKSSSPARRRSSRASSRSAAR